MRKSNVICATCPSSASVCRASGDQLETSLSLEWLDFRLKVSQLDLLPGRSGVVVLANELPGEGVEFRLTLAGRAVVAAEELADVQEGHDQEVEGIQAGLLDRKATVAIRGVAAFHLHPHLG
jgi:hypothetical protein